MKVYDGLGVFGGTSGVISSERTTARSSREVEKKKVYTLRRVENLKRQKDTFQLEVPIDDLTNRLERSLLAYTYRRTHSVNQERAKLLTNQQYVKDPKVRPQSTEYNRLVDGNSKLAEEHTKMRQESQRLAQVLHQTKKRQFELINRSATSRSYEDNSYLVQTAALKTSDNNFNRRRYTEAIQRQLNEEIKTVELLKTERDETFKAAETERMTVEKLLVDNDETYKRILEKQRLKKELEDKIKQQEQTSKYLVTKIESLKHQEQTTGKMIETYLEVAGLKTQGSTMISGVNMSHISTSKQEKESTRRLVRPS